MLKRIGVHWQVVREVEVAGADTAGQGTAERSLQSAGAEGQQLFAVREEEAS